MTSFTKPEVHNVLHCRQRTTEQRPQLTCTENFEKFGHVAFERCERTDMPTDTLIATLLTPAPGGEVIIAVKGSKQVSR